MVRLTLVFIALVGAVAALPAELPNPADLALVLGEEEFEDYLDFWLEVQQRKSYNESSSDSRNGGCTINVNGDLGQPQPVYLRNGNYLKPSGNSGQIRLNTGDQVYVACTGSGRTIRHPNIASTVSTGWATCVNNALVSGAGWLKGNSQFGGLTCSAHSFHDAEYTSQKCYNNNKVIRVGYYVDKVFYPLYYSCYDQSRFEVLYTWYEQNPENSITQTGVDRPNWLTGSGFYNGVGIDNLYKQVNHKAKIATYVGQQLADKYVTNTQFLSRGHLAAKSDFIFATGQRSTFYFINAAPQWQPFNGGNWNSLEQNLRTRIGVAGYRTTVYTGTFGVAQLRDQSGKLVDIYLYHDANNNPQLPIPLYYYKVVYDANLRRGTAFVSINNPYYTAAEVRALTFCTDRCRNNSAFNWIGWNPDRIDIGYSFCCDVNDFRKTVPHLPSFPVDGLLS